VKASVTVRGADEVARAFRKYARDASDLREPGQTAGDALARDIASRTPRRTGRLAGSWRVDVSSSTSSVSSDVPYGPPVEYGVPAHNMRAARMVADAVAAAEPSIGEPYEKRLEELARSSELG
jgi:hypothetical protein